MWALQLICAEGEWCSLTIEMKRLNKYQRPKVPRFPLPTAHPASRKIIYTTTGVASLETDTSWSDELPFRIHNHLSESATFIMT